jgi:cupin fold WbuC family metalloprotein
MMEDTVASPLQAISAGVFGVADPIVTVTRQMVDQLARAAAAQPLKRARLCAHRASEDPLHEMLIVLARGTYIRPHRHFRKSESFHVIEGTCDLVLFDDSGGVQRIISLGAYESGKIFFYRLSEALYHTVLVTSDRFIIHETTNGPLRQQDSEFAAWSPAAEETNAARDYMNALLVRVEAGRQDPQPHG